MSIATRMMRFLAVYLGAAVVGFYLSLAEVDLGPIGFLVLLIIGGGALQRVDWWSAYSLGLLGALWMFAYGYDQRAYGHAGFMEILLWTVAGLGGPLFGGLLAELAVRTHSRWVASRSRTGPVAAPTDDGRSPARRRYCLYCFATLPGEARECDQCGRNSMPSLRRIHWNLNPKLRREEKGLKLLIVILCVVACGIFVRAASGPGAGWFFLLPVWASVALWMTASKITHHETYFRPDIVWGMTFVLLGTLQALKLSPWSLLAFAAAGVVLWICKRASRWKRRLVLGEQENPSSG